MQRYLAALFAAMFVWGAVLVIPARAATPFETVPLPQPLRGRALALAGRAVEAVPGLAGWVGVDLVLGEAADGREDTALEINPRLTTSYIGLRALAEANLAGALLAVFQGRDPEPLAWRAGAVHFRADGKIRRAGA